MPPSSDGNIVALTAVVAAWIGLASVMLLSRRPRASEGAGGKRDTSSMLGLALQGAGIAAAWFGTTTLQTTLTQRVWLEGAPVAVLALAGLGLFVWSAATMGANWSLVARTRAQHDLVQSGPFALMRNPIYVALFLMMIATALAADHAWNLAVAIPLYAIGTISRVGVEERLLRETFGQTYADYTRRVKRFVPGIV